MMNADGRSTLITTLDRCRTSRYSGLVCLRSDTQELLVWFVRGNLAHAENPDGETGWKALESLKGHTLLEFSEEPDALPPQRTIRVDTVRLLRAMRISGADKKSASMHVPVPLHLRLQKKFGELKQKVTGLQSFEMRKLMESGVLSNSNESKESDGGRVSSEARTMVEKDPRGARWTQQYGNRQLRIIADETISTTELMWAGSELWHELERLNTSTSRNEN
ncbi:MAG: DUF4388 domain-containing protein [Calditrichaeota bacterium]|nr:DUF4388 domain-containing protein [Calditrichota bacterium]MCB9368526.1 DUF4388 domain-containing protein [Calditrichota bacterium]